MKVVFCSPGLTYLADAPHRTRMCANGMASQGLKVTVMGFSSSFPADPNSCAFDYVSVFELQAPRKRQRWLDWKQKLGPYWTHAVEPFLVKRAAFQYARQKGADVLYVSHVEPWIFLFMAWLNHVSKRRIPTVGMIPYMFRMAAGNSRSAKIRAWLNEAAVRWLPRYCEITCDNIHVARLFKVDHYSTLHLIPEGHQELVGAQSQADARKALGILTDRRMLLLFGVVSQAKGADSLFSAMDGLDPKFMVYVVGQTGGVYGDSWGPTDRLKEKGWGNDLHVIPRFVSEEEMAQFFSACDGIVLPYRQGFAVTSGNLMKAIEYGKAIIVSDQYYIGEVVRKHNLGLMFPPENVEGLRRCLVEFSEKPDSWFEEIRRNSRRVVQEQSWTNVGALYRKLFERIVSPAKPEAVIVRREAN